PAVVVGAYVDHGAAPARQIAHPLGQHQMPVAVALTGGYLVPAGMPQPQSRARIVGRPGPGCHRPCRALSSRTLSCRTLPARTLPCRILPTRTLPGRT